MAKPPKPTEVDILEVTHGELSVCILGASPFLFNRVNAHGVHELLFPKGRKTQADKAATMKHDPVNEFRDSVYRYDHDDAATRLYMKSSAFKGAMMTAALDIPEARRTEIGRLTWVDSERVEMFGIPILHCAIVRMADIARTPDVRTRAILTEWACRLTVKFAQPKMRAQAVANLLAAGGLTSGVGDGRQEKGKLSFGQFQVVDADHPDFVRITRDCGRDAQDAALEHWTAYDDDTAELIGWFHDEVIRRGRQADIKPSVKTAKPRARQEGLGRRHRGTANVGAAPRQNEAAR